MQFQKYFKLLSEVKAVSCSCMTKTLDGIKNSNTFKHLKSRKASLKGHPFLPRLPRRQWKNNKWL